MTAEQGCTACTPCNQTTHNYWKTLPDVKSSSIALLFPHTALHFVERILQTTLHWYWWLRVKFSHSILGSPTQPSRECGVARDFVGSNFSLPYFDVFLSFFRKFLFALIRFLLAVSVSCVSYGDLPVGSIPCHTLPAGGCFATFVYVCVWGCTPCQVSTGVDSSTHSRPPRTFFTESHFPEVHTEFTGSIRARSITVEPATRYRTEPATRSTSPLFTTTQQQRIRIRGVVVVGGRRFLL